MPFLLVNIPNCHFGAISAIVLKVLYWPVIGEPRYVFIISL
jgi:hypothetical protein